MSEYTVTMDACVAGNPLKAWRGGTDPDDVWESQTHEFASLEDAKLFVRVLPEQATTHVKLWCGGVVIFDQDADADHLDAAAPDVAMPHTVDSVVATDTDEEVPDAPPTMPAQGATG